MLFRTTALLATPLLAALLATAASLSASAQATDGARSRVRTASAAAGDTIRRLPPVRANPPVRRTTPPRPPAPALPPVTLPPRVEPTAVATRGTAPANGESWDSISARTVNDGAPRLPVGRGAQGPTVLRVQVMLDRAFFSPGMIDGKWGKNTEHAVFWLQQREGLPATGVVDEATWARLERLAGPASPVRAHVLSARDVAGPFVAIPADIYEHAKLRCSCYESLAEKLTEAHHTALGLLRKLNPRVDLNALRAGDSLVVPAVRDPAAKPAGVVRQLLVSGESNYLHAVDAEGRILYHFPATLGSTFDPSPQGDFRVTGITPGPWWHYQPRLLAHVPDDRPNAMIPPGPNNAVGAVWVSLSAPHYGIHGTKSPETIGYATSAGCVRLTNWDVRFLSERLASGVPVRFTGTRPAATAAPRPAAPAEPPRAPDLLGVPTDSTRPAAARPDSARPARTDSARPAAARPDSTRPAPAAPAPPPRDTARAAAP